MHDSNEKFKMLYKNLAESNQTFERANILLAKQLQNINQPIDTSNLDTTNPDASSPVLKTDTHLDVHIKNLETENKNLKADQRLLQAEVKRNCTDQHLSKLSHDDPLYYYKLENENKQLQADKRKIQQELTRLRTSISPKKSYFSCLRSEEKVLFNFQLHFIFKFQFDQQYL